MASLTNVLVAGGNAEAAVARVEMLSPAGFAGLAVSSGIDIQNYASERQLDLVLFEGAFDDVDAFEVARSLKRNENTRHIPLIMLHKGASAEMLNEGMEAGLNDMLDANAEDEIIIARLQPLVRLSTMHAEFDRRIKSANAFGLSINTDEVGSVDTKNCRVLFVGAESPAVSALADALGSTEFNPVFETDHFKAGARVAEEIFDSAVITVDDGEPMDKALHLCAHIRNNPRLFNLPVLIAAGSGDVVLGDAPYKQGASIAVPLTADINALTVGLLFLVRRQRLRWNLHGPLTATLQPNTADSLDGLYSEKFLRAHLSYLLELGMRRPIFQWLFSPSRTLPVSAIHLKIKKPSWSKPPTGFPAWCVSRIGRRDWAKWHFFCVVLPGAADREAQQATDRIAGVLQHSPLKLADGTPMSAPIWVQSSAVAATQSENVDNLISRARAAPV